MSSRFPAQLFLPVVLAAATLLVGCGTTVGPDQATYTVTAEVRSSGVDFPSTYSLQLEGPYDLEKCEFSELGFGTLGRELTVPPGASDPFTLSADFRGLGPGCYKVSLLDVPPRCRTYLVGPGLPGGLEGTVHEAKVSGESGDGATVFDVECTLADLVIYSDMEDAAQWTQIERGARNGATSVTSHPASGGVSGGYREIQHVFPDSGAVNYFHAFTGQTYDPSTQGAIASLTFSDHRQQFEPTNTASVGATFALSQGDVIYYHTAGEAFGPNAGHSGWVRFEATDLTAADFAPTPGPDLTATGGLITFGFLRSNTRRTASALTVVHGTDEFEVVVKR